MIRVGLPWVFFFFCFLLSLKRQSDILEWCVLFSLFVLFFYSRSQLIMVANIWKDDNRLTTWAWKTSSTFKRAFHAVVHVGVCWRADFSRLFPSVPFLFLVIPLLKYSWLICMYNVITDSFEWYDRQNTDTPTHTLTHKSINKLKKIKNKQNINLIWIFVFCINMNLHVYFIFYFL